HGLIGGNRRQFERLVAPEYHACGSRTPDPGPRQESPYDVVMPLTRWLHDARDDLWFGCRRLIREREASAAMAVVLTCGIALSVAIFTISDAVLRRPLPVGDQERVVVLWGEAGGSMRTLPLSPQHFERFRKEARALQEVAGTISIDSWTQSVRDGEQSFPVNVSPVTGNF